MAGYGSRQILIGMFVALAVATVPLLAMADVEPPGSVRDRLTFDELMADIPNLDGPIHNDYFMPVGDTAPAHHAFRGILDVARSPGFVDSQRFPELSVPFVTVDGYLVPAQRDIIRSPAGQWDIVLSAGRVWSEPGDNGWSRASFPFVLTGDEWNDSHNGLATFLYNDTDVSDLQVQIVQEASSWSRFDAWARTPMTYRPDDFAGAAALAATFTAELAQRLPTKPLTSLDAPAELIDGMERDFNHVTVTALLNDGVLYRSPCYTRFGDYPYCDEMRHGVFSTTKTAGAALSLLWLAQTYGPEVFDLRIVNYVDVNVSHDGWQDVTFRDAIDMATGIGEQTPNRISTDYDIEDDEHYHIMDFGREETTQGKLEVVFRAGNYEWGPGQVVRYNSLHTFILAVAMDAYLKSREGPDANLWDRVVDDVLIPIGVHHAPLMHTREDDGTRGVPIMGWGFFPTVDDLAKIAQLYQDHGAFDGRQLLYADEIDRLLRGDPDRGLPVPWNNDFGRYSYAFSWWYMPYVGADGCRLRIPEMMGFGGNVVALMPNGMTGLRLADADEETPGMWGGETMAALADSLRSFCP